MVYLAAENNPEYQFLLPFTPDAMQEMFLHISGMVQSVKGVYCKHVEGARSQLVYDYYSYQPLNSPARNSP